MGGRKTIIRRGKIEGGEGGARPGWGGKEMHVLHVEVSVGG